MFRTHLFTALMMVPLVACSAGHDHPPVLGISLPPTTPSDLEPDSGAAGSPDLGAGGDVGTSTGGTPSMLKKPSRGSGGSAAGVGGSADVGNGGGPAPGAGGSATGGSASGGANPSAGGTAASAGGKPSTGGQGSGGSGTGGTVLTGGSAGTAGALTGGMPGAGGAMPSDAGPSYGPSARVGTYNVTTACSFRPPASWFSLPVIASSRPECVRCDESKLSPQQRGCVNWCAATGTFGTVTCSAAAATWSDDGREFTQSFLCLDSATNSKVTMSIDSIQSSLDGTVLVGTVYVETDSSVTCNDPFTAVR